MAIARFRGSWPEGAATRSRPALAPAASPSSAAVLRKETLQTVNDKRLVFMLLLAPTMQLLVFGYAVDFKVDRLPTVIVRPGPHAARAASTCGGCWPTARCRRVAEAAEPRGGRASAGGRARPRRWWSFPTGFARALGRGETAQVQVVLDGSDPNRSNVAAAAVTRYFAPAGLEYPGAAPAPTAGWPRATPGGLELRPRIWFNPQLDTPPFMIPGIMAMLLIVVTTIVTAMGLAREREMGTLEQVLVTPIRPWVLLVGKMLPFVVIGVFDVLFALTIGAWLFAVPIRGGAGGAGAGRRSST